MRITDRLKHSLLTCCLLPAVLLSMPSVAQNNFELSQLGQGEILLNLSITEQTEVDQDLLTAVLQYSSRGRDRTALQDEVNSMISDALDLLADSEGFEYSTQQYHVYAITPPRGSQRNIENPTWQAQQSIRLTGTDAAAILEMAGALQAAGLHMTGLSYSLSPETHQAVQDSLLASALGSLQSRADEAASLLGKQSADLVEVSLNDSQNIFYRREAMAMADSDSSGFTAPVAEPGKTTVSLNVTARALLIP